MGFASQALQLGRNRALERVDPRWKAEADSTAAPLARTRSARARSEVTTVTSPPSSHPPIRRTISASAESRPGCGAQAISICSARSDCEGGCSRTTVTRSSLSAAQRSSWASQALDRGGAVAPPAVGAGADHVHRIDDAVHVGKYGQVEQAPVELSGGGCESSRTAGGAKGREVSLGRRWCRG